MNLYIAVLSGIFVGMIWSIVYKVKQFQNVVVSFFVYYNYFNIKKKLFSKANHFPFFAMRNAHPLMYKMEAANIV